MLLEIIDQPREWDRFVENHPDASFSHLFGWSKVISSVYGHKPVYLAARDDNTTSQQIRALLPLFRFNRPFFPPEWISVPFLDHGGILADSHETGTFLLEKTWNRIKENENSTVLCLRQDDAFNAASLQLGHHSPEIFTEKIRLAIPLAPDRETMMAVFPSKLRSQIKKGIKNNLHWKVGGEELLTDFYTVFARNMRDLGSPVHSRNFYTSLFQTFPERVTVCMIYHDEIPAAGGIVFRFKQRLVNPWASSIREYRHLNTNMLLYWQMIGHGCDLGLKYFDMGRSSQGASTYRFKKQWGPEETPLSWCTWKSGNRKAFPETVHIAPWRYLPLWCSNLIGPLLRKNISL